MFIKIRIIVRFIDCEIMVKINNEFFVVKRLSFFKILDKNLFDNVFF